MFLSLQAFAQQDSFRFVTSDPAVIRAGFSDRHPLDVHVAAASPDGGKTWTYSLVVSVSDLVSRAIPQGGLLLVRTLSDEVIELRNEFDELQSRDYEGSLVPGTAVVMYKNKGSYTVTLDQLEKIALGVRKVRIEFTGETVDSEYKKDKWSEPLTLMLQQVRATIATTDVREGF